MGAAEDTQVTLTRWGTEDHPLLELSNTPEMTRYLGGPESPEELRERHERYLRLNAAGEAHMFRIDVGGDQSDELSKGGRRNASALPLGQDAPSRFVRGNALVIEAFVPLAEMFGYATDLRSSTQGRATYTMQFERYEEVPTSIAEQIAEHRTPEPVGAA